MTPQIAIATCTNVVFAQVAELVDALASGASVCMDVEVRVLSWAPILSVQLIEIPSSLIIEGDRRVTHSVHIVPFRHLLL